MWRIVFVLVLVSGVAYGEISVKQYRVIKAKGWQSADWFQSYVSGMGEAFVAMNAVLQTAGRGPVYCAPPKMALQVVNYLMIIDEEVKGGYVVGEETPMGIVLLLGLITKFPCPRK